MSEPVGVSTTVWWTLCGGAVTAPCLAAWGFNPPDIAWSLFGCMIAQTFLRSKQTDTPKGAWALLSWAASSILFSVAATPFIAEQLHENGHGVSPAGRALLALLVAGSAQPIVVNLSRNIWPWLRGLLPAWSRRGGD